MDVIFSRTKVIFLLLSAVVNASEICMLRCHHKIMPAVLTSLPCLPIIATSSLCLMVIITMPTNYSDIITMPDGHHYYAYQL